MKTKQKNQKYRPRYHFSAASGWINDPNGLICQQGIYHLYYQYNPAGITHGPMHWGHALSFDLWHWAEQPIALYPHGEYEMYSGCAVLGLPCVDALYPDQKNPLALVYTEHQGRGAARRETQNIACSWDGGISFVPYTQNPVLDEGRSDFRDPKLWRDPCTGLWTMLLAVRQEIWFYQSADGAHWQHTSSFQGGTARYQEAVLECPDLLCLPGPDGAAEFLLLFSVNTNGRGQDRVVYYHGKFSDGRFTCTDETEHLFDFGPDHYATTSYFSLANRTLCLGWMNNWLYAEQVPQSGFRGSMSFPRELCLSMAQSDTLQLRQVPARELWRHMSPFSTMAPEAASAFLPPWAFAGRLALADGVTTICFANTRDALTITVDTIQGRVSLDRTRCEVQPGGAEYAACTSPPAEADRHNLLVLADTTSIEVFYADGALVGTMQFFIETPFTQVTFSKAPARAVWYQPEDVK